MNYEVDRSPSQSQEVSLKGAQNPLNPNSVTLVERVNSGDQGRNVMPGEDVRIEVDGELDVMKAVDYIRQRISCEVYVQDSAIIVRVGNLSNVNKLQRILREWADNESAVSRIDIQRAA